MISYGIIFFFVFEKYWCNFVAEWRERKDRKEEERSRKKERERERREEEREEERREEGECIWTGAVSYTSSWVLWAHVSGWTFKGRK